MEWKKSNKLKTSSIFSEWESDLETEIYNNPEIKPKKHSLQDQLLLSNRYKEIGSQLATEEKFSDALSMWNKAISFNPNDETLYEMKAQVLMILEEDFPAVKCAELSVHCNKLWSVGWLTLGRAQMNINDFKMAKESFCRAIHLDPLAVDVCKDDLNSAVDLWKRFEAKKHC